MLQPQARYGVLHGTVSFADRLEKQIIPALNSGLIVLADRYMYTAFSRNVVCGVAPQWIRQAFGFALQPDLILYLDILI